MGTPIAIIIAGAFIALAIYFGGSGAAAPPPTANQPQDIVVAPVSPNEHIFGDPNAPITIIEYSDLECPFCKQFHGTMKQIIAAYPGEVKWVYRNFPLEQLHPNAPKLAEASECVAELGGNQAYWKFLDEIFRRAPINTPFPMGELAAAATSVGVDGTRFTACYESGKYVAAVQASIEAAIAAGGQGTPHNILVTEDGEYVTIPGAQPFEAVKAEVEKAL